MLITPADNLTISSKTYSSWLKSNGMDCYDSPSNAQILDLIEMAKTDPATLAEISEREQWLADEAAKDAAKEAEILRITGLCRDDVMALAMTVLRDGRGHWPIIDGNRLVLGDTSDQAISWSLGESGWSKPYSTRGSREDSGAGYGMNQ